MCAGQAEDVVKIIIQRPEAVMTRTKRPDFRAAQGARPKSLAKGFTAPMVKCCNLSPVGGLATDGFVSHGLLTPDSPWEINMVRQTVSCSVSQIVPLNSTLDMIRACEEQSLDQMVPNFPVVPVFSIGPSMEEASVVLGRMLSCPIPNRDKCYKCYYMLPSTQPVSMEVAARLQGVEELILASYVARNLEAKLQQRAYGWSDIIKQVKGLTGQPGDGIRTNMKLVNQFLVAAKQERLFCQLSCRVHSYDDTSTVGQAGQVLYSGAAIYLLSFRVQDCLTQEGLHQVLAKLVCLVGQIRSYAGSKVQFLLFGILPQLQCLPSEVACQICAAFTARAIFDNHCLALMSLSERRRTARNYVWFVDTAKGAEWQGARDYLRYLLNTQPYIGSALKNLPLSVLMLRAALRDCDRVFLSRQDVVDLLRKQLGREVSLKELCRVYLPALHACGAVLYIREYN